MATTEGTGCGPSGGRGRGIVRPVLWRVVIGWVLVRNVFVERYDKTGGRPGWPGHGRSRCRPSPEGGTGGPVVEARRGGSGLPAVGQRQGGPTGGRGQAGRASLPSVFFGRALQNLAFLYNIAYQADRLRSRRLSKLKVLAPRGVLLALCSCSLALCLPLAAHCQHTSHKAQLQEAENAFRFQDYVTAEKLLYPLLHPEVVISDPDDILKAREYLGACYYWLGNEKRMEEEFTALLTLSPTHRLDPFYYPPELIEKVELLRARLAELKVISVEGRERRDEKHTCVVPKETISRRSRWVAMLPFGVGQFYNGANVKGALFLTGETLALGTNIASYFAAERLRGSDGFYSPAERRTAEKLRIVQYASLGFLVALALWDILDANLNFEPEERHIEMVPCPTPMPSGPPGAMTLPPPLAHGQPLCVRLWFLRNPPSSERR